VGGIAYLFGGPGQAEPGMGRDLYNKNPLVRESVDKADKLLTELGGVRPTKACFAGDAALMRRPSVAGPAVLALAHGTVRALKARRLQPNYAGAFGWGELVALGALGLIDYEAALRLIYERGKAAEAAWEAAPWHALSVQGLPAESLEGKLSGLPQPPQWAARFSPDHFVLCGHERLLTALHGLLEKAGRGVRLSPVEPGWHWPQAALAPVGEGVAAGLEGLEMESLGLAIQPALDHLPLRQGRDWPGYFRSHGADPLDWTAACRGLKALGMDTAVEIGHGQLLGSALHRIDTDVRVLATEDNAAFAQAVKLAN
jgi:[acyl-carrier-protein] S-malonyltransferase